MICIYLNVHLMNIEIKHYCNYNKIMQKPVSFIFQDLLRRRNNIESVKELKYYPIFFELYKSNALQLSLINDNKIAVRTGYNEKLRNSIVSKFPKVKVVKIKQVDFDNEVTSEASSTSMNEDLTAFELRGKDIKEVYRCICRAYVAFNSEFNLYKSMKNERDFVDYSNSKSFFTEEGGYKYLEEYVSIEHFVPTNYVVMPIEDEEIIKKINIIDDTHLEIQKKHEIDCEKYKLNVENTLGGKIFDMIKTRTWTLTKDCDTLFTLEVDNGSLNLSLLKIHFPNVTIKYVKKIGGGHYHFESTSPIQGLECLMTLDGIYSGINMNYNPII
ncbi:hypothetical protein D3C87_806330 [compost metagenome]